VRRLNSKTVDKKAFRCPQCGRHTLLRPLDFEPSLKKQEYKTRDGGSVELYVDVCSKCERKNFRDHFEPRKSDVKRVLKGLHGEDAKIGEGESLEELL